MLSAIDLSKKLPKSEYKETISSLELRLGYLQREARAKGIPVVVVFEGWDAAGKGTLINRLLLALDPRGFTVHATNPPTEDERLRPFLWRFWIRTPARGRIAIFDRSWYGRVMVERVDKITKKADWQRSYAEINAFERQLADDGCVLIKLFLHITREEQKKRFRKLQANKATAWKVTQDDWKHNKQYDKYKRAVEEMLGKTETEFAPWTIIEAHDSRFATVKLFSTVIEALERRIRTNADGEALPVEASSQEEDLSDGQTSAPEAPVAPKKPARRNDLITSVLDTVTHFPSLSREEYRRRPTTWKKTITTSGVFGCNFPRPAT
jgi:polyphosphate kinase 2 (PPK2 family)